MDMLTRKEVWEELKKMGAVRAVVFWSGSGDEGFVNKVGLYDKSGECFEDLYNSSETLSKKQKQLLETLIDPVENSDDVCPDGDGMEATLTWNVETKKVTLQPSYYVTETQDGEPIDIKEGKDG